MVSTTDGSGGVGVEQADGDSQGVSSMGKVTLSFSTSRDSTEHGGVAGGSALDNCNSASANSAYNNKSFLFDNT